MVRIPVALVCCLRPVPRREKLLLGYGGGSAGQSSADGLLRFGGALFSALVGDPCDEFFSPSETWTEERDQRNGGRNG